ncbi:MAG TPA: hypothetical protein VEL08_00450, partial [Chthoniobacterales bacterium]|nr:hypothetical protein [Chthoniobacterales bacterium]
IGKRLILSFEHFDLFRHSTFVLRHFREIHLSFVIFPSIFRAPNDSERLSTCPAPAGLISERGRKDR